MTNQEAICILNAFYRTMSPHAKYVKSDEYPRIYIDSTTHNIDLLLKAIDIAIKAIEKEEENDTSN